MEANIQVITANEEAQSNDVTLRVIGFAPSFSPTFFFLVKPAHDKKPRHEDKIKEEIRDIGFSPSFLLTFFSFDIWLTVEKPAHDKKPRHEDKIKEEVKITTWRIGNSRLPKLIMQTTTLMIDLITVIMLSRPVSCQ